MRDLVVSCLFVAFLAALGAVFYLHIPIELLATWGMGALCLVWLVGLVVLPWNVHFEAKHLLFEMQRSRERGIPVAADREAYAISVRDRMLKISIWAHLLSALVMAIVTWVRGGQLGYYFAAFYLLSTFFRPGVEYYRYLITRLFELKNEVKYPREDVIKLRGDVMQLQSHSTRHEEQLEELQKTLGEHGYRLESRIQDEARNAHARSAELDRRIVLLSRKFEETVDKITDNQEIIAGVKAFLRLVREPGTQNSI